MVSREGGGVKDDRKDKDRYEQLIKSVSVGAEETSR